MLRRPEGLRERIISSFIVGLANFIIMRAMSPFDVSMVLAALSSMILFFLANTYWDWRKRKSQQ
jgi:putative flippase GtrA